MKIFKKNSPDWTKKVFIDTLDELIYNNLLTQNYIII